MNPSLADQLKDVKLDTSDYSRLPIREDVLVFKKNDKEDKDLLKQWEKLHYLRNHLKTINRYIQKNKGEKLYDWLRANNTGLSKMVLDKIGNHNNETGGISMYFLNLQNFYDGEEEKYDKMESDTSMPGDLQTIVREMMEARTEKRQLRRKARKLQMRDMKKDGKGYLYVDVEEPKKVEEVKEEKKETPKEVEVVQDAIKKTKSNIAVWIAGTIITIGVISLLVSDKK